MPLNHIRATTAHDGLMPRLSGNADEVFLGNGTFGVVPGSGSYTPTLTNITNVTSSAAYLWNYMRVGSVVTVSGRLDVTAASAAATQVDFTIPVASNFASANLEECAGVAYSSQGPGGAITAQAANDRASLFYVAPDTALRAFFLTFTYRIL